jgi:pilus assembly protein FimV
MPFNKSKALESALKFLNQGKVAQAIGEYQQILRHDPKDQATLMTVGDLFARQNDMTQATEYFERLAQVYLHDGFNSKAIAIYKKIAKLAPAEIAPLERLADLYVQQGVLSEARPLFLQIAEAHLKANRAPKAVEVLHRLLEVEPENPRVQMRLAELYNVMGQKKEAAQTYFNYAQRLFDRSENDEAEKLIERALGVDAANAPALLLKAKILAATHKNADAIAILGSHPEADAGSEVTNLLVDLELGAGHVKKAADRARKQLTHGSSHFQLLHKVAENCIESGKPREALPLIRELRDPLIEANEHDRFVKLLSSAIEKLPGDTESLELLADFARHTSDPFQLNTALDKLAEAYRSAGDRERAEQALEELIEHNKGDERLHARLEQLRGGGAKAPEKGPEREIEPLSTTHEVVATPEVSTEQGAEKASLVVEAAPSTASSPTVPTQESLDEETQKYVAQALTDVDLFSSYGLTQKATALLENVLQRAPRHTPTLERLLDLYLGAGNEKRTAELASQLEQIHRERGDNANADRFTELRQRFERAAGLPSGQLPAEPATPEPISAPEPIAATSAIGDTSRASTPSNETISAPESLTTAEFEVPLASVEVDGDAAESQKEFAAPQASAPVTAQSIATPEEVDLSDEWEAMVQEVEETPAQETAVPAQEFEIPVEPAETAPAGTPTEAASPEFAPPEPEAAEPMPSFDIDPVAAPEDMESAETEVPFEFAAEKGAGQPEEEVVPTESAEFELELAPESSGKEGRTEPATTDDFLRELAAEVDGMDTPTPAVQGSPVASAVPTNGQSSIEIPSTAGPMSAQSLNELSEVFQEFRSELGEMGEEDEDLETHYNLGIAYREMGLLDEAIGEFQKVAKAVQAGKSFPYAMNCSTLLAMSFMDKGEPKIASLWYERALEVPGLDPEAILALRYDLAISLDMAGESSAALNSFRQVYAMNIDYRDVADRIATLQKH